MKNHSYQHLPESIISEVFNTCGDCQCGAGVSRLIAEVRVLQAYLRMAQEENARADECAREFFAMMARVAGVEGDFKNLPTVAMAYEICHGFAGMARGKEKKDGQN